MADPGSKEWDKFWAGDKWEDSLTAEEIKLLEQRKPPKFVINMLKPATK